MLQENIPCPSPSPNVQVPIKSFTKMKGPVKQLKETLYYRRIFHTWEQCEKLISEKKVGGSILHHPPRPHHFCNRGKVEKSRKGRKDRKSRKVEQKRKVEKGGSITYHPHHCRH